MRIRKIKKNPTSRRMPMNMWEINKNWRATGNPKKDKERKFQENAKEQKQIKKNRRANENPRKDKKLSFQQNAKKLEGDREKQEKE